MSSQASDIAREAQEGLDGLMHDLVRVFQDVAATMFAPQLKTKSSPSRPAAFTL